MSVTFYNPAPLPSNEHARNRAVYDSGLLNIINNPALNAIAASAKNLFQADWAGITLIFDDVQEVIASSGGRLGRYDRARSLSAHAILMPSEVLCLGDAKEDGRFGANPFVRVDLIRFFVAAPILDAQGYALGALCASSRFSRLGTDPESFEKLQVMAAQVIPTLCT